MIESLEHVAKFTTINAETAEPAEIHLVCEFREFCVECRTSIEMSSESLLG